LTFLKAYARIKITRKGKPVARTDGERGESLVSGPAKSSEENHTGLAGIRRMAHRKLSSG